MNALQNPCTPQGPGSRAVIFGRAVGPARVPPKDGLTLVACCACLAWKSRYRCDRAKIRRFHAHRAALAIPGCRGIIESMDAKRVIDEALRLPVDIRAALAGELLASLDDSELEPDREAAWSTEIRDRIDAYERGDVTAVPVDEALAQIRAVRGKAT
jgi:putative addiction module component (TIGR02574 family)